MTAATTEWGEGEDKKEKWTQEKEKCVHDAALIKASLCLSWAFYKQQQFSHVGLGFTSVWI